MHNSLFKVIQGNNYDWKFPFDPLKICIAAVYVVVVHAFIIHRKMKGYMYYNDASFILHIRSFIRKYPDWAELAFLNIRIYADVANNEKLLLFFLCMTSVFIRCA